MRKLVAGKLHGIYVTEANLNYHGSITLDPDHCEEAGILPMEFVEIWNKNSGARISTYVILGERGSRCCILNGAAARTCQPGDQIIICNSIYLDENRITSLKPKILTFDENNHIQDRMSYSVSIDDEGRHSFEILDDANAALPIPLLVTKPST
ncbi:aspartate decarboxylase [Rhizobium sp. R634]|uniref:aspartate 1-decarboxylase n=1 Tax=Rhizobium sp. R634 TaxID=1764274 RepID=UPI000B52CABB|nr:aspartate 1-decarboxylase [Rhizobium sp. R634]OWV73032.1 aspartate decarboxylase [Rhizobium sp. R634]OWV73251.1 aspartate decarboxylase [Rhizobium sp. R634]